MSTISKLLVITSLLIGGVWAQSPSSTLLSPYSPVGEVGGTTIYFTLTSPCLALPSFCIGPTQLWVLIAFEDLPDGMVTVEGEWDGGTFSSTFHSHLGETQRGVAFPIPPSAPSTLTVKVGVVSRPGVARLTH